MTGCLYPGESVWLSPASNPERKLAWTWELAWAPSQGWIGVNTQRANQWVREALVARRIEGLKGWTHLQREVRDGHGSRIDFCLEWAFGQRIWIEVKSVTLHLGEGLGAFPDAVSARGRRHLEALSGIVARGGRAVLFFCVQHQSIDRVCAAAHIDPSYAEALEKAIEAGVEVMVWGMDFSSPCQPVLDRALEWAGPAALIQQPY
jgi:sugar fermentation stimulation protein A